jgi:hypothetical protein
MLLQNGAIGTQATGRIALMKKGLENQKIKLTLLFPTTRFESSPSIQEEINLRYSHRLQPP